MYQQITVLGRLGKDPELKELTDTSVAKFSLAADSYKNKEEKHTEWFHVVVWGKTAIAVAQYLKKGSPVLVAGEMRTRSYNDKSGETKYITELIANPNGVKFVGGTGEKTEKPKKQAEPDPDEIPF